jgi:hypothetical protein
MPSVYSSEVIKNVNIFVDRDSGLVVVFKVVAELQFNSGKEALGYGVVPTVALSTHALDEATFGERFSKSVARVLRATVRVEDTARCRLTIANRHRKTINNQLCVDRRGHLSRNNCSTETVDDGAEIYELAAGSQVSNVRYPN